MTRNSVIDRVDTLNVRINELRDAKIYLRGALALIHSATKELAEAVDRGDPIHVQGHLKVLRYIQDIARTNLEQSDA